MPSVDSKPSPHLADAANEAGVGVNPCADRADRIEDVLPQTQCTKCGYAGCRPYAEAIAAGEANYNQCPPGGQQGIARIAGVLGKPVIFLNVDHGPERERPVARIDENRCIGCTLCIQACPVDAILGAAKQMHVILPDLCTGCDLCVPACPVDCIDMLSVTQGRTGWDAWSQEAADAARDRHDFRAARLLRERQENDARLAAKAAAKLAAVNAETPASKAEQEERERKKAIIAAAIERARLQKLAALEALSASASASESVSVSVSGSESGSGSESEAGSTPGPASAPAIQPLPSPKAPT